MEPEDLDLLYRIENDMELWSVGNTNVPYSRYALHDYIANASGDIYADKQLRLMIESRGAETVGIVDIVDFNPQHLRAEIGIVIQRTHRSQGYAHAALDQLINYCQRILHLHQIYAVVDSDNQGSVSLFESMGFGRTAELREWLYDGKNYHTAVMMQRFL
ncbi:MAG: GNAT family N-acetyltransferase [Prevotella sp.]|nr:GNAT family N-acetyltransferase [Prevotella sp.]